MTKSDRKFARFYFDDFMREYPAIYADDAAFAAWWRLLTVAEKMWPTVPELPRSVKPRALRALTDAGLVILCDAHCYRIRGLDAERTRRQAAGRKGAAVRWDSDSNANASALAMPSREQDENEQKIPPPPAERGRRRNGTNPRAQGKSPRQNGASPRDQGESPRQEREAQKRGPTRLHEILRRAAEA